LAELWLSAADREAVANAADEADRLLSVDPFNLGESRGEAQRIFFISPLAVLFCVEEDDRKVNVIDIWRPVRRRR
jgi:hypothetical protein